MAAIEKKVVQIEALDEAHDQWKEFESQCETSFFLSWEWVSTWYACAAEIGDVKVFQLFVHGEVVGLAVGTVRTAKKFLLGEKRQVWIGESGDQVLDRLTIEHNGIVHKSARRQEALSSLVSCLRETGPSRLDEIYLSGITSEQKVQLSEACEENKVSLRVAKCQPYFWVDLSGVSNRGDYLAKVSGNTRWQILNAMKKLENTGKVSLSIAGSLSESLDWFGKLVHYHQSHWTKRGKTGAFDSQQIVEFHKVLIATGWPKRRCQILRIAVGNHTIGYLYMFVYEAIVYFYQSGINYSPLSGSKPGIISHVLAIEYYAGQGLGRYDFMAGESQYKRSLSTNIDSMFWVVVTRKKRLLKY